MAGCVVGAERLGRPGVPGFRALVAMLGTVCLLSLIGIPASVAAQDVSDAMDPASTAAPMAGAFAPSPTPQVPVAAQRPSTSESPQPSASTTASVETPADVGVPVLLGHSVQGRAIRGVELGAGPRWVAVIGGIHQGNEANTTVLAHLLLEHFRENPAEIPDGVGLAIIPDVNPESAVPGTRVNANGVDLNRNWDAGWQPDSYGPSGLVPGGGGTRPFSEPETRALAEYLVGRPFVAAIFLHSKGGVVVPGPGSGSAELASAITRAAQYTYLRGWTAYPLSGQASKYLVERGIHVAVVELSTHTDPDFARNLRGLRAALAWALELPEPTGSEPVADAEFSDICGHLLGTYRAGLASPLCPW